MPDNGIFGYPYPVQYMTLPTGFTSDLTRNQTYTENNAYSGRTGDKAFDDLWAADANCWLTNGVVTNCWVCVKFNVPYAITKITVRNGSASATVNRCVQNAKLEGSDDGVSWTKIPAVAWEGGAVAYSTDEFTLLNQNAGTLQTITFSNPRQYYYYRVYCYNNYGDAAYLGIAEIEMMASAPA